MKILIVSNEYERPHRLGNPIIGRMITALKSQKDVEIVSFCPFQNNFSDFGKIRKAAKGHDLIHIQFGGLYAFLVWFSLIGLRKPKFLTFHGTDIHAKEILTTKSKLVKLKIWLSQKASFCSIILFDKLGFVSPTLLSYIPNWISKKYCSKMFVQPLGVDYDVFVPLLKEDACNKLDIPVSKYALFSDKSGTILKRRDIADAIIREVGQGYELLIMCGVNPDIVPVYVNASDFVILTSDEEGSPNITREALALNKRVFSFDVGDVKLQLKGLSDSAIIPKDPKSAATIISDKLVNPYSDNTREKLRARLDFNCLAEDLVIQYKSVLTK